MVLSWVLSSDFVSADNTPTGADFPMLAAWGGPGPSESAPWVLPMGTASHTASQVAHQWPTTTFLRPPVVTALASGGTSMIVPAQVFVGPATPDSLPHAASKPALFDVSIPAKPMVASVKSEPGSVVEAVLVIVVVLVIARLVVVRVFDAAGRLVAHVG